MVWITVAVSVATLIVGTIVTLSVAAMHRRQMRQIELHRADPTVPVVPPPHPFTEFLLRILLHASLIFSLSFNGVFLMRRLLKSADPPTRDDVFSIALFTNGIFLMFAIYIMMWSTLQTFKAIGMCVEQICNLSKGFGLITDVLKKQAGIMKEQADLVGVLAIKHAVGKDEPPKKH